VLDGFLANSTDQTVLFMSLSLSLCVWSGSTEAYWFTVLSDTAVFISSSNTTRLARRRFYLSTRPDKASLDTGKRAYTFALKFSVVKSVWHT